MKPSIILAWTCLLPAFLPIVADAATLLTFDELPIQTYFGTVPNGYATLQWNQFGIIYPQNYPGNPGGYLSGMLSPSNVAFNAFVNSDGTTTGSIYTQNSVFDLDSAYLTAAWNDGLQMIALGFLGDTLTYSNSYTLSSTSPTFIDFNYDGIDRVSFISSGGTPHGYGSGGGTQVAFDNLVVTIPEPGTRTMFILGAALIWVVALRGSRRRSRRNPGAALPPMNNFG